MSPLIGLVGAWVFIVVGMVMKGGTIAGIISIPAFLMVMGGTLCVLIASFGLKETMSMVKLTMMSLKERVDNRPEIIKTLVGFSEKARREGLLVLEEDAKQVEDPFLRKGVRLVVDGTDPELVKDILETELDAMEERHHQNQDMFKQGGAFAPTIGILGHGALAGLGAPAPGQAGPPSAPPSPAAFLATFYGVAAGQRRLPADRERPEEVHRAGGRRAPADHRGRPVHPERRQPADPGREARGASCRRTARETVDERREPRARRPAPPSRSPEAA